MNGLANTSDGKQQIVTDIADVLRAMPNITVAEFMRGTSRADDTGTRDGTRKTYFHSVSPAIFSEKENSTFLDAISTAKNAAELKRLCKERTNLESSRKRSWGIYTSTIANAPLNTASERRLCLETGKRRTFDKLRKRRIQLLKMDWSKYKRGAYEELARIQRELFEMTGHHGYYVS